MLPIKRQISAYNHSAPNNIQYLVIHGTGSATTDTAEGNANYFCSANRGASAHLFVDNDSIVQVVEFSDGAWHVGDGNMAYGIGNHNSIGIEMCHTNGTVSETTENNTVELVKYLMAKFNIDINHVVRHYDASRKNCPASFSVNNWARWNSFKSKLVSTPTTTEIYRVRTAYDNASSQIGAFSNLDSAKACADSHPGYTVYDSKFNRVYPSESSSQSTEQKKGIAIVYGNEVDQMACKYVHWVLGGDEKGVELIDGNIPKDYSQYLRVICIGGLPSAYGKWTCYATDIVSVGDRVDTLYAALKLVGR